jgi:1,4-alpha-glucan branching enzyme
MKPPKPLKTPKVKTDRNSTAAVPHLQKKQLNGLTSAMTHDNGISVRFEIVAKQESWVYVAGTFNDWNPTAHPLTYHPEAGLFRCALRLLPGTYHYRFVVDGVWHMDAKCPHWVLNYHGSLDSVLWVCGAGSAAT